MPVRLTTEAADALRAVLAGLDPAGRDAVERAAGREAEVAAAAADWDFLAPARVADAALGGGSGPAHDRLRRGLAARWALGLPERVDAADLPPQVTTLVPGALARLATFLHAAVDPYDDDFWAKDVRFALALTVPCGAQVIDLEARIGPGEVARHVRAGRGVAAAAAYVRAGGWGRWLQIHTESRDLGAFDAAGWDDCYRRIAAVLERRPALRGVMGSSWFYDPPLRRISPRLAYLQDRPLQNGAFLIHQGTSPLYTERAVQTSPTRRALVEAGTYTPRSWILAWPRAGLIRWARSLAAGPGV